MRRSSMREVLVFLDGAGEQPDGFVTDADDAMENLRRVLR
jgi:hypothetical protein